MKNDSKQRFRITEIESRFTNPQPISDVTLKIAINEEPFMATRNWSPDTGEVGIAALRESMDPMIGQLPHIVGFEGMYVFPSALLLMTFLSFFIGIFLQLMWEELPITEPL